MTELKRNRIPRGYEPEDSDRRVEWLKDQKKINIEEVPLDNTNELKGIIENHIGYMKLPMAIAGPLDLKGEYANGEYMVPICTLEGTLSASMNRGMYATSLCDGITTQHYRQELSRAPVFIFDNLRSSKEFQVWVEKNKEKIAKVAESTTQHGKIIKINQYPIQNYVILDFVLDTGNAAGQNMVTLAAKVACDFIKEKTGNKFFLESNLNSDKKASIRNMLLGRGHGVIAETTISSSVMNRVLGVDPKQLNKYWSFFPIISSMAGTIGNGIHISNALTAIYLATGQDTACVAENSIGHFEINEVDDGLSFRLTLPSLTIGTVGGGTRLNQQQQNLKMLGCTNEPDSSKKLAEIIAGATLSLEISLLSAIASHTWTSAHMKYGRK